MLRMRTMIVVVWMLIGTTAAIRAQKPAPGRGLKKLQARTETVRGPLYTGSHALVIGVQHYPDGWDVLSGVATAVDDVSNTLEGLGFSVAEVKDPTGAELHEAFRTFVDRYGYEAGHRLLVFFIGHGHVRKDGRAYIVPANAPLPLQDPKGFLRAALPMTQIIAWARTMEAKHVLFVLDCGVGGSVFGSRSQSVSAPVMDNVSRPVRQFIVAGSPGELSSRRGVFSTAFCAGVKGSADVNEDGFVTGTELGMYIRGVTRRKREALSLFGKIRDPDLDEGDFCFRAATGASATEHGQLKARLANLRKQRRKLEAEARTLASGHRQLVEWDSLELALEILEYADARAARISTEKNTKQGSQLAEILCNAASRALTAGDMAGASALVSQATELSPGRGEVVELFETVRTEVAKRRLTIRRDAAMKKLKIARELTIPEEVRGTMQHIDDIFRQHINGSGVRYHRIVEGWYDRVGILSQALQAVANGQGSAIYAEIELLGPLVAHSNSPVFHIHVGNLTTRDVRVALSEGLQKMRVVLTGPLPRRETFALPEPLYNRKGLGKPRVFRPYEYTKLGGTLISPERIPDDFFQSRDYPVPLPGTYELHVEIAFPEKDGTWAGSYRSLPQIVRMLDPKEFRAKNNAR